MATTIESSEREIKYPQQAVYQTLSNLSNVEKYKEYIPAEQVKNLDVSQDHISVNTQLGDIELAIVERKEPQLIKFSTRKSPVSMDCHIQILPLTNTSCKMKLVVQANMNPMLGSMLKKPLEMGIEKVADLLQKINYE